MAITSVVGTGTTSGSTLAKVWRKIQAPLVKGFNAKTEEWSWLKALEDFKVNISAREITVPIDIARATHSASIVEGGYEAYPQTTALNELTLSWSNYNHRFASTLTAKYLRDLGQDNQVIDQFKYQAKKAMEGLSDTVGRDFYGFSTGIWAQCQDQLTFAPSGTITLINGYGSTDTGLDNAAYLGAFFVGTSSTLGDRIALMRGTTLVPNAIGVVTAVTAATPTITVTFNGTVTISAADSIVLAMSIENATLSGGTNANKALNGLMDMTQSSSLHSLATSTEPEWAVGVSITTAAARYSGITFRKQRQAVENKGGGKMDTIVWSNGISNDAFGSQSGALRFSDPFKMELDGEATAKGVQFKTSRKVPISYVWGFDSSAIRKFSLVDMPSEESGGIVWDDGDKMEGQNAVAHSIDFPLAMVCLNRRKLSEVRNAAEQ